MVVATAARCELGIPIRKPSAVKCCRAIAKIADLNQRHSGTEIAEVRGAKLDKGGLLPTWPQDLLLHARNVVDHR